MADRTEELRRRLFATFRVEAEEHLSAMTAELAALGQHGSGATAGSHLDTLFRAAHTLKGAARSVGFAAVEEICHHCETLLRRLTRNERTLDAATVDLLQEANAAIAATLAGTYAADRLPSLTTRLDAAAAMLTAERKSARPSPGAAPSAAGVAARAKANGAARASQGAGTTAIQETVAAKTGQIAETPPTTYRGHDSIRVETDRLDRLIVLAEDLLIPKLVSGERLQRARALAGSVATFRGRLRDGARGGRSATDQGADDILREMETQARQLADALADDHKTLRGTVDSLYDEMRRVRMMPAEIIFAAFPHMVRDLARETGKDIAWELLGAGFEVDRKILDLVKDPLIHLVRNAVDHGIEAPEIRRAAGKPARGQVGVRLRPLDGGRIAIEVYDDGRGLDTAALRDAAVRARSLDPAQANSMSDDEVLQLAFRAGVSTSPVITAISGHGLGLAIVRERIERIDGRVEVRTLAGAGTTVALDLPSSIATFQGLLVEASGTKFLWPAEAIERAIAVPRGDIAGGLGRGLLTYGGQSLPFGRLSGILGLPPSTPAGDDRLALPCLVVRNGERRGALLVDAVLGQSEVLIKELRSPLRRVRNIAAAGLLGTGELVLVLRPSDVLTSINAPEARETITMTPSASRTLRVLVVDDSITTRTMERNLFEAAGYTVRTAADGIDAWAVLQNEDVDIVVSDVDMPRMDGFELTSRVRGDARLIRLPVILVTALESREDKERGIRVGANAYVLKSGFDQSNLLEIVGRLI